MRGRWKGVEMDPAGSIPASKFGGRPGSDSVPNYASRVKWAHVMLPCGKLLGWTLDFGLQI
eukprot:scaffold22345_cov43-Attheya_sp.AAC.1